MPGTAAICDFRSAGDPRSRSWDGAAPPEQEHEPHDGPALSCVRLPAPEGGVRLLLAGELDLATVETARTAISRAQAETRALTCDLRDVWFVDVSGLHLLVDAAVHAMLNGDRFALANCPRIVQRMLQLLHLDDAGTASASRAVTASMRRCERIRPHVS